MSLEKVLYTASATSTGGREGSARSSDGALNVKLVRPKEMGGQGEGGTNPEQLFAAGYSACFLGAMNLVAGRMKLTLPADTAITAAVSLGPIAAGFGIQVQLSISAPGVERTMVDQVVAAAHEVCPYSNATRGNVDVTLVVV